MSRYWNYKKIKTPALVNKPWRYSDVTGEPHYIRNSEEPLHVVTHRAIGDIPGCTLAPREHTFVACTLEEAQVATGKRAEKWRISLLKYVNGEYGGNSGLEEMWKAIETQPALLGPHGEKL